MTISELKKYNGETKSEVYLSINGTVYDVTSSEAYKPPKGGYCMFAGKEIGASLAKMDLTD